MLLTILCTIGHFLGAEAVQDHVTVIGGRGPDQGLAQDHVILVPHDQNLALDPGTNLLLSKEFY